MSLLKKNQEAPAFRHGEYVKLNIKSANLFIIVDKIYFALTVMFMVSGVVFFLGFMTKVFIVNQSIFKLNAHEQQQFSILKKCLNGKYICQNKN